MLKSVQIGHKTLTVPIIQGGMGVGVSLGNLAGHVMKENAMGVISAAHPGYKSNSFRKNSKEANYEAIKQEVQKARTIAKGKGLLAMNIMVASTDYKDYVKASIEANVDAIISGAGLPLELPSLTKGSDVLLAPIVSSAKTARLIAKSWDRHYGCTPDFVVIEGSEAGGHLGFKKEDLLNETCQPLDVILKEVQIELEVYRKKYNKEIPVFVAGGIFNGEDIAKYIKLGADGVQIGTRFIATHECDADDAFKQAVLNAKKEDITIVKSPAGLPGRALMNTFMRKINNRENICITNCLRCMKPCKPQDTPYCISEALIQSVQGNIENGLLFVGSNASRIDHMVSVHDLICELKEEANLHLEDKQ